MKQLTDSQIEALSALIDQAGLASVAAALAGRVDEELEGSTIADDLYAVAERLDSLSSVPS